jgi:hypothetical protein
MDLFSWGGLPLRASWHNRDYLKTGWPTGEIARLFHLTTAQVDVAVRYIEEHWGEVMADYEEMLARHARGNPPELQAKLDAGRERFLAKVRELREARHRLGSAPNLWPG